MLKAGNMVDFEKLIFSFITLLWIPCISGSPFSVEGTDAIARFREYLRFDTSHPQPNYGPVTKFLVGQAEEIGLDVKTLEYVQGKPTVLMSWHGAKPSLPSVLLNSHTDVVPADAPKWKYPPFAAEMDESGNIYARGAQDMKCVGTQYLEAIRSLKAAGFQPERSIHVSFVPDEEIGAADGAKLFYSSEDFESLKVGFVFDEGLASEDSNYRVFYGERTPWWFYIKASGHPGHGSRLLDGMALENLRISLEAIAKFRKSQFERVKAGEKAEGEVVSINNVYLKAGTTSPTGFVMNVQPSEAEAGFDMRIPPSANLDDLQKRLQEEWAPASRNLTYHFIQKSRVTNDFGLPAVTAVDDTNPWWTLLKEALAKAGGKFAKPEIFMASSDARHPRFKGIPALGFSPMTNTPVMLHETNEFLNAKEYLNGIEVYAHILQSLTGSTDEPESRPNSSDLNHSEL